MCYCTDALVRHVDAVRYLKNAMLTMMFVLRLIMMVMTMTIIMTMGVIMTMILRKDDIKN